MPVGHGTAEKDDDQDCDDEGDDKRFLPEPEDVIQCPGTQAGHDDDCAKGSAHPTEGPECANQVAILLALETSLRQGQQLCCLAHDETETEHKEPATQAMVHEVGREELARKKG